MEHPSVRQNMKHKDFSIQFMEIKISNDVINVSLVTIPYLNKKINMYIIVAISCKVV